jgi:acyl carrier protein
LLEITEYRPMSARKSMAEQPSALEIPEGHAMADQNAGPRQRLIEIVQEMLVKNGVTRPVSADDQLSEAGLKSLDMVNLMLAVEAEFDITIPSSDITPKNFRSIASIEALILKIRAHTAAA